MEEDDSHSSDVSLTSESVQPEKTNDFYSLVSDAKFYIDELEMNNF